MICFIHLLTLVSFQTYLSFFLWWNKKYSQEKKKILHTMKVQCCFDPVDFN